MSDNSYHIPVMLKESLDFLNLKPSGIYVDTTLGGGGHTEKIKSQNSKVKIIGIDQDKDAIEAAKKRLAALDNIEYVQDNFKNLKKIIAEPVDGILFDLGVSSYQINEASRGFSVKNDGPLDMRMDQSLKISAADIVNNYEAEQLTEIFFKYSEERFSLRIARAIAESPEIKTTSQLKTIIEKAIPTWKKRESVTRIFQALRIVVNQELQALETVLPDAIELLKPGGRLVVLAYHSLEDRIVKHTLRNSENLTVLTKKPVKATEEEIALNPRAKSAKLRAGEKL